MRMPRALTALQRKLLRDVWRLRGQMLSIASLVACGVATVVAMHGTLRSVERARDRLYTRQRFADVFATATRVPMPVAARIARIPGVAAVETRAVLHVSLDVPGLALPAGGRLVSVPDHGDPALGAVHLTAGRMVRPFSTSEVVVSVGFASANGLTVGDSLGAVLDGRWRRLHIVGLGMSPEFVWELAGADFYTADQRAFGVLWMSRAAVEAAANLRGAFDDLALSLTPGASSQAVRAALDTLLAPYGGRGAVARERQPSHYVLEQEFTQLRVFGLTLPLIFLLVAGFLLNVTLARVVATQRAEIAALKAFGYTDREVGAHYLAFAGAAVALGALGGVAVGAWMGTGYAGLYARFFRLPDLAFRLDPTSTLVAIAASGAASIAGAMLAVRGAVRLAPAEALRPEAPERYRPLLLERLGLASVVPPAVRMVLRTIERRPLRALSSIVGVSLAIGLLAGTLALFDAAYYMADVIFRRGQREDITVSFTHALPATAGTELAHVRGVLAVEPVRMVPVRVRSRAVVRTTAMTGLARGAVLHRTVDGDGHAYTLPPTGAVLSTSFARQLGVARGDTLYVELLERGDAVRAVVATGFVDELVGANIYMERAALDRLVGDGERITGAYLRVDPRAGDAVLARLKRFPAISGASSRQSMIDAFDRQMAESVRISGSIVVAFAIVIALSVVYNGARIALSERGRELASLRVLGFSRREVAAMLFGEQGALVAVAIPLGVLAGFSLTSIISRAFEAEDHHFPFVVEARTYLGAIGIVILAGVLASLAMRRRLNRMDLVAVLKTRE